MPNYRYNTPDYMRRNNGGCQSTCTQQQSPAVRTSHKASCCEDRADYDALSGLPIAMAYVPWQDWYAIYEVEKGFHCGTIFEELNKPFRGIGGCC